MAQNVTGLDLGSSAVKAVTVKLGLRGSEIVGFRQEPVELDAQGYATPQKIVEAAGRLFEGIQAETSAIHCAIAGDAASVRTVMLPASASRRMEQVLKFELDEVLPYDIDEAVFDFVESGREGDELKILCAVAKLDKVKRLLEGLAEVGLDPREIGVSTLAYGVDFVDDATGEVRAVLDIGHMRTNIAVVGDVFPTVRTILRGGRDLTARLAEVGNVDFATAEGHKITEGLRGKVGEVLLEAVKPLIREVRQTLTGHLAAGGKRVQKVLLCGGGSRLIGLERLLADELGVPVEVYGAPIESVVRTLDTDAHPEVAVLAHALARYEEIPKTRRFNVRRGVLAFKGDYEYLKSRVAWAFIFALLVLSAWIFSNYAQYSVLDSRAESQRELIREETQKLFGKPILDQETIEEMLMSVGTDPSAAPMPVKDAFDVVVELSRRIPPSVVHDVEILDIKPKRITLKATVDSELQKPEGATAASDLEEETTQLSPTDLIHQKLTEFDECFTSIRIGKVQTVGERRTYQMDIDSKCP